MEVEQERRVRAGPGEGGQRDAFRSPAFWILVRSVRWGKKLGEECCHCPCRVRREPERGGEGDVDFLETAVGNVLDGCGDARRERGGEGGHVAFQPAQGAGHNHFVEVGGVVRDRGDGDRGWLPALDVRFQESDLCGGFEFGFGQCGFSNVVED